MDDEVTYAEAAKLLGVGERRVRALADEHGWKRERHWIDKRKRVLRRADVERFAAERPLAVPA